MNYAVEQRIRFVDVLLVTYGTVNRSVLIEYFGISAPCATRDLTLYKKLYPGNMTYDEVSKAYVKAPKFKRAYS